MTHHSIMEFQARRRKGRITAEYWVSKYIGWRLIGLERASKRMIGLEQWCQHWGWQHGKVDVTIKKRLAAEHPWNDADVWLQIFVFQCLYEILSLWVLWFIAEKCSCDDPGSLVTFGSFFFILSVCAIEWVYTTIKLYIEGLLQGPHSTLSDRSVWRH